MAGAFGSRCPSPRLCVVSLNFGGVGFILFLGVHAVGLEDV